jgi:hypothetical protein
MSVAFRVYGLPRSGTTWASNWLTTDHSLCWHDPCESAYPGDIERWAARQPRLPGISCTGSWHYRDWAPEVPTICLDRPYAEILASLERLGLPGFSEGVYSLFQALPFPRYTLADMLNPVIAKEIWTRLLPSVPFDQERHWELAKMNVQPSSNEIARIARTCASRSG